MLGQAMIGVFVGSYGTGGIHEHNDIRVIQLDSSVRGKGIGRALMTEFESMVYPGLPIKLDVLAGNAPAIGFYKHLGFSIAGSTTFQIANEAVPILNMQKQP